MAEKSYKLNFKFIKNRKGEKYEQKTSYNKKTILNSVNKGFAWNSICCTAKSNGIDW